MAEHQYIKLPVGRIVGGHPMRRNKLVDEKTGQPVLDKQGQQAYESYVGYAIPKQPGVDWKQTEWGQQIQAVGVQAWPRGEHAQPAFAWKIVDGDSAVPNKNGIPPNTREGYPGHWVINAATRLIVKCYHAGRFAPEEQIQNEAEIKPGDYGRLVLEAVGNNINGATQSPGVFLNPIMFILDRAGIEIVLQGGGPSAAELFGNEAQAQLPPGAQVDPNMQAAAPQPGAAAAPPPPPPAQTAAPAPAPDFLNGPGTAPPPPPPAPAPVEEKFLYNGQAYTRAQLAGWTDEQIAALPKA